MTNRRLFRRRENGEWAKRNAYIGVTMLALAVGAAAWAALLDPKPQPSAHPAKLVAAVTSTEATLQTPQITPEPPLSNPATPAAGATTTSEPPTAPATLANAAPPVAAVPSHVGHAQVDPRTFAAKSHVTTRVRRARFALAAVSIGDGVRTRSGRASSKHRVPAQGQTVARLDPLDRPYIAPQLTPEAPRPKATPEESQTPSSNEPPSEDHSTACSRAVAAFGAMRRIPSDC